MQIDRLLLDSIKDAWRCLSFERSRAVSFPTALRAWRTGQAQRWRRLRRMGLRAYAQQLSAESACADVGLLYPNQDAGACAPWHLPEQFSRLTVEELPRHPVIDPAFLAAGMGGAAPAPNALQALAALACSMPIPTLWAGLPLHGVATPLTQADEPPARVAVCLHLFYPELWPELHAQLSVIPEPWDLFVSVPVFAATPAWRDIQRDHPRVRFLRVPNRGRDVAPFLAWLRSGALDGYDVVCKLHGKRSPHMRGGDAWRDELLQSLLGSASNAARILAQFHADPALGIVGPSAARRTLKGAAGWAKNQLRVQSVAHRLGWRPVSGDESFFAGTMFWFRPRVLATSPLVQLCAADFPLEMGQTEGTLAHAIERLLALVVLASGARMQTCEESVQREVLPGPGGHSAAGRVLRPVA